MVGGRFAAALMYSPAGEAECYAGSHRSRRIEMKCLAILLVPFACASALAQQPRVGLTFITDQTVELLPVVQEAQKIWASEGDRIIQAMEDVSGLKFEEKAIVVIVHRAPSVSGAPIPTSPLKLNARYPVRMSLVHELGHRLNASQIRNLPKDWPTGHGGLDSHKLLNLFLYDVWVRLYGSEVADQWVQTEKQWADLGFGFIKEAWEWALALGEQGRASKLREIIQAQDGS
jgi:hypothetical protein